jgi:hypothetical protein
LLMILAPTHFSLRNDMDSLASLDISETILCDLCVLCGEN